MRSPCCASQTILMPKSEWTRAHAIQFLESRPDFPFAIGASVSYSAGLTVTSRFRRRLHSVRCAVCGRSVAHRNRKRARSLAPSVSCRSARSASGSGYSRPMVWMTAGPMITMNSTGRKKMIIGTVSFGGSAAAFFSASDIRMSRFSLAITRSAVPTGVP